MNDEQPPSEYLIPSKIVVSERAGEALLHLVEHPPPPTPALRELLAEVEGE